MHQEQKGFEYTRHLFTLCKPAGETVWCFKQMVPVIHRSHTYRHTLLLKCHSAGDSSDTFLPPCWESFSLDAFLWACYIKDQVSKNETWLWVACPALCLLVVTCSHSLSFCMCELGISEKNWYTRGHWVPIINSKCETYRMSLSICLFLSFSWNLCRSVFEQMSVLLRPDSLLLFIISYCTGKHTHMWLTGLTQASKQEILILIRVSL